MINQIFISYSEKDIHTVSSICKRIELNGYRCFFEYKNKQKEINYSITIKELINNCQLTLIIYSENYNNSIEVENDLSLCLEFKKPMLILKLSSIPYSRVLKNYLFNINYIELNNNFENEFQILESSILKLLNEDKLFEINHSRLTLKKEAFSIDVNKSSKNELNKNFINDLNKQENSINNIKNIDFELCPACPPAHIRKKNFSNKECYSSPKSTQLSKYFYFFKNNIYDAFDFSNIKKKRKEKGINLFSLFAPSELKRNEEMLVQVYLHSESGENKIKSKSKIRDKNSELRANEILDAKINYGDTIEIALMMPRSIKVDIPTQKIVYNDEMKPIDFIVAIPSNYKLGDMIGTVFVCKESIPLCSIKFVTKIVAQVQHDNSPALTYSSIYKKVFVSYSSTDREEVLKITSGLKALNIDYFLDKLYLKGGDKYENKIIEYINEADLFLLCWSANAEQSDWVRKEYSYALERLKKDYMKFSFYPLIINPKALPPKELIEYHFVDL